MGVALWLVPPKNETRLCKLLMDYRPIPASSPLSYPSFHPHITLASIPTGDDLSHTVKRLQASVPVTQQAIDVPFDSVEHGDHYFRSVYAAVEPTSELDTLHAHIHEKLGSKPNTPKFPHISVYYIADEEAGVRREALEQLRESGIVAQTSDRATIDCSKIPGYDGTGEDKLFGYRGAEIWIALCDGPVETWSVVERITLK